MDDIYNARRDVNLPLDFDFMTKRAPLERVLALAKAGAVQPASLDVEEIRIVCDMLLNQYAQMGID